jgi:uncharacterized protein (DUF1778 family)
VTRPKPKPAPRSGPRGASGGGVLLRLTVEEREELRRAAVNNGRPLAQWIRWVALEAARGSAFR